MKNTNWKRTALSIIACLALVFALLPGMAQAATDGLTTTTIDGVVYYEIEDADDLYAFAQLVNGGDTSANAILTADIVVNEGTMTESSTDARAWTPIGSESIQYSGKFDGAGYTISGLYMSGSTDYAGLFGHTASGSEIKNVGLVNSYIYGSQILGSIVGSNYGTVTGCFNTGTVRGTRNIGGVVGINRGTVVNCYNTGSVSAGFIASEHFGGVVGTNRGAVENCYNTGKVSSLNTHAGGVVGYHHSGTITNCYYLAGCATDGNGTVQNGVGSGTKGSTTTDTEGSTTGKTAEEFASGKVAYLLGDAFGQTIGTDACPVFRNESNIVYRNQTGGCNEATYTYEYSNTAEEAVTTHAGGTATATHKAICENCGAAYGELVGAIREDSDGTWRYYVNDAVATDYIGLVRHTDGKVYYVYNGVLVPNYVGFYFHSDGNLYYISQGSIAVNYTGFALHTNGKLYYVVSGVFDPTFNGTATFDGDEYEVVNGIAQP